MVTAEGVLDQARNWIGYQEEPDGDTPFSRQWGFPGGAWCGMFCQSMVVAAGGTVGGVMVGQPLLRRASQPLNVRQRYTTGS